MPSSIRIYFRPNNLSRIYIKVTYTVSVITITDFHTKHMLEFTEKINHKKQQYGIKQLHCNQQNMKCMHLR